MSFGSKKIFILIHDDYAAGGLQRSALALRDVLASGGHDALIYSVDTLPGGLSSVHDFVRPVTQASGSKLARWFALFRDLRNLIVKERPQVLIGLGRSTAVYLSIASLGLRDVRLIGSERTYPGMTQPNLLWRALRRLTFKRLDYLVCQTRQTREWFIRSLSIPPEKLPIIPNIVYPAAPATKEIPPFLSGCEHVPLLASIGRLEHQKGHELALRILGKVNEEVPDARLLIIGEGTLADWIKSEAQKLGLIKNVIFHPRVDGLGQVWPHIDVFLLASRYEGFPNVLAEAMANGVASVAFDCPTGPSDLISNGKDGFLIPAGDLSAAAAACVQLIRDPQLRARMGKNARGVAQRFSKERVGSLWLNLVAG